MTPPAATTAARAKPARRSAPPKAVRRASGAAPGAAPPARGPTRSRPASSRAPATRARRKSGPAAKANEKATARHPQGGATARTTPRTAPRTRTRATPTRRRASTPARRLSFGRLSNLPQIALPGLGQLRPLPVLGTIGSHAFRVGRVLPDSRLFDRLVRGRVWIGLLAVLLFGLVAINVSLLKMNSAAGHNAERLESLRIQNDRLRARVSRLGSGDRVERVAGGLGLVMPAAANVRYLTARPGDGTHAAKAILGGRRVPGSGPLANAVEAAPLAVDPIVIPPSTAPTAATGPSAVAPAPATAQTQQTAPSAATTQPGTTGTTTPGTGAAPTQTPAGTPAAQPGATGQPTGSYTPPTG